MVALFALVTINVTGPWNAPYVSSAVALWELVLVPMHTKTETMQPAAQTAVPVFLFTA
jgi:hypothetical protein